MKKFLSLLTATVLTAGAGTAVVACNKNEKKVETPKEDEKNILKDFIHEWNKIRNSLKNKADKEYFKNEFTKAITNKIEISKKAVEKGTNNKAKDQLNKTILMAENVLNNQKETNEGLFLTLLILDHELQRYLEILKVDTNKEKETIRPFQK